MSRLSLQLETAGAHAVVKQPPTGGLGTGPRGLFGRRLMHLLLAGLLAGLFPGAAHAAGPAAETVQGELWFAAGNGRVLLSTPARDQERVGSSSLRQHLELAPGRPVGDRWDLPVSADHATTIRDAWLADNGRWLALQVDRGLRPVTWLVELGARGGSAPRPLVAEASGFFLGWHPKGDRALFKALDLDVPDSGLWLVEVADGRHETIELPGLGPIEGLMAAAISPDGRALAYAFTKGLGTGSELWLKDLVDGGAQRLELHPHGVVGSLRWSPDGDQLAYNTLYDSTVPFAEAGLWVYEVERGASRFLTLMDGGHGEEPLWSDDGESLVFIARDNTEDPAANRDAAALESSVRSIRLADGFEQVLVPSAGARQVDLHRARDGRFLFASDRDGVALEIWSVDADGARPTQLTSDGLDKRHPVLDAVLAAPALSR